MTGARVAVQLDPVRELDDFQTAARALITHGLVTNAFPHTGVLAIVRRFEEALRNEFARLCHWRLDVGPTSARLLRRHVVLSPHRPARTATQTRRAFKPQTYALLCMLLAGIEGLGEQTSVSQLADEIVRLRAGDDGLPFDPTLHAHRRAFVDAVAWLEQRGVLTIIDGDAEAYVSGGGDALYDIDGDVAGRLLVSPPSVLSGLRTPDEFLDEPYPPTDDAAQARARHRVHRRLLTTPALYYDELPGDERDYARQRRTRIRAELERLTGCTLECRAEGQALVGMPAAEPFPATGAVAQAALLLGGELVQVAADLAAGRGDDERPGAGVDGAGVDGAGVDDDLPGVGVRLDAERSVGDRVADRAGDDPPLHDDQCSGIELRRTVGRTVERHDVEAVWARVVGTYSARFTADYRAEPDRLRDDALDLLTRLDLVRPLPDGDVVVRPALARYRADVRLPEVLDV